MMFDNDSDEFREQSSIYYYTPDRSSVRERLFFSLYGHMFVEDVSLNLLPTWRGVRVAVEHDSESNELYRELSSALDVDNMGYHSHDLAHSLGEFLKSTLSELFIHSRSICEIVYLRERPSGPRKSFKLIHLDSAQIIRRRSKWYQIVPPEIACEKGVLERIHLPSENIVTFTLPDKLARSIASAMETLIDLSDQHWHELALEAQSADLPYDFSLHNRTRQLALAEAARDIGWMGRGLLSDDVTNYYSLRQSIRFKLFVLEVREALLAQLNAVLQRVGLALGWTAQLSVKGLLTRPELEQALKDLASGDRPFTEIFDSISQI